MNNDNHPNAVNNTVAREFIGARLTDVINGAATRMASDPNHATNINRNIEIVRNVLAHAIRTVACIGGAPATLTVAEWYCDGDEIEEPLSKHIETYTIDVEQLECDPLAIFDIANCLVNTDNHVISIS